MTPPQATRGPEDQAEKSVSAVSVCAKGLGTIRHRRDFLRANRGNRVNARSFMIQGIDRRDDSPAIRVGFTCSKKVGNAVARNRAKRRLREIARAILPELGRPGWDYVLIGFRDATAARPFADLTSDLRRAMAKLHAP